MFCEGELLSISENETLFQLIGTTYGGDGQSTFALPDLRGRIPLHQGQGSGLSNYIIAESGGVESVTLTTQQIPSHTHAMAAAQVGGNQVSPAGNVLANSFNITAYINDVAGTPMANTAISPVGGSQPHDNFQPYICINYIISLFGIFPSPN